MKKVNWQYLIDALLFISVMGVVIVGFLLAFVIPSGPIAADSAKYFLGLHRHEWGNIHLYLGITFTILAVVHLLLGWKWVKGKTQGLFGNRWKATLFAMCLLAFGVLVVSWLIYPGELGTYDHSQMRAVRTDRGILKAGETPSYDPSNAIQKALANVERPSGIDSQPGLSPFESEPSTKRDEEHRTADHRSDEELSLTRGRGSEDTSAILITGQMTLYDIENQTGISVRVLVNHLGLPRNISPDEKLGKLRRRYGFSMQELRDSLSSLVEKNDAL